MKSFKIRSREYCFFDLFEKFIQASKTGRRLQPNGKRISEGTIRNYQGTLRLVRLFAGECKFQMRIVNANKMNKRVFDAERNYWKNFT